MGPDSKERSRQALRTVRVLLTQLENYAPEWAHHFPCESVHCELLSIEPARPPHWHKEGKGSGEGDSIRGRTITSADQQAFERADIIQINAAPCWWKQVVAR